MANGSNLPVPYQPPQPPAYYPPPIIYTGGGGKSSGNTALTLGIVAITLVGGGLALWWVFKKKGGGDIASKLSFEMEPLQESVVPGQTVAVNVTVTNNSEEDLSPEIEFDIKCSCRSTVNESNEWVSFGTIAPGESVTNEMSMTVPADWSGTDPEVIYGRVLCKGHSGTVLNDVIANITPIGGPSGEFEVDRDLSGWENTTIDVGDAFAYNIHWKTGSAPVPVRWVVGFRQSGFGHAYEYNYTPQTLPANSSGIKRVLSHITTAAGATYDGVVTSDPTDNTGQEIFPSTPDCLHVQEGGEPPSGYDVDSVEAVGKTVLHAGEKATVKVDITNNGTSPITNKSFRLDLIIKGTLITGTPKTVTIPVAPYSFQLVSGALPTTLNDASYTIDAKLKDITVSSNIIPWDYPTLFTAIGDSYLANIGGESLVDSMLPADRLVSRAGGTPLTFNMRYKHRGSSKNYKCGVWIKDNGVDGGYWLQKTFTTTESTVWENGLVALTGTFRATPQLHTGQDIECYFVFMEATVTPAKPPQTQQFLFANWDTILRVKA